MIRLIQGILLVLILTFLNGCASKEPEVVIQTKYVYEKPYNFVLYDTQGMRIDAGSKKIQQLCTPIVIKVGKVYRRFITGYEDQIKDYKEIHNDNR